jgi:hypothetical protein
MATNLIWRNLADEREKSGRPSSARTGPACHLELSGSCSGHLDLGLELWRRRQPLQPCCTGLNGIRFTGGGTLHIENCVVDGFGGSAAVGIDIVPMEAGKNQVFIKDTIVRNNGTGSTGGGIQFKPAVGVTVKASLDNVRSANNVFGVKVQDNSTGSISDSVAAGNGFAGFSAVQAASGPIAMTVSHSTAVNNGAIGIQQRR